MEKCADYIKNGPYQSLKKDPTTKLKAKTLKQSNALRDNEFIDNKLYYFLKPSDSLPPRFSVQPKIVRSSYMSNCFISGPPLCNLNKYMANILKTGAKDENNNPRSSRPEVFCKMVFLEISLKSQDLFQSLFSNKVAGLRPVILLKRKLWERCFPVNFVKFLRTPFFIENLWWLLQRKNSTTFSNYIITIEDDEIMVSFDVISLSTNILNPKIQDHFKMIILKLSY